MGRLRVGVCNTLWYRPADYYAVPWRGRWESELGGVSMCLGVHIMDLLLYLLDDWTDIRAMMATLDRDIENENVACSFKTAPWSASPTVPCRRARRATCAWTFRGRRSS